ncbi:Anoctamin like protein [Aduncisulcus paluster]|uniref:Anoctamin like protein n=1 Tax=Aduncisulcus paluster TaxID=2918883 RepID=A0ABQ5KLL8_9EUKA|nr:Anoctamin like protein [Aduncisulcus paluster]
MGYVPTPTYTTGGMPGGMGPGMPLGMGQPMVSQPVQPSYVQPTSQASIYSQPPPAPISQPHVESLYPGHVPVPGGMAPMRAKPILPVIQTLDTGVTSTPVGAAPPPIAPPAQPTGWFAGFRSGLAAVTGIGAGMGSNDIDALYSYGTPEYFQAQKAKKRQFVESFALNDTNDFQELSPADLQHISLDLLAAEKEYHFRGRLPFCCSGLKDIGEVYGHGIRYYFFFLYFLCFVNFIQLLFSAIPVVHYFLLKKKEGFDLPALSELLFYSSTTFPLVHSTWRICAVLTIIWWFLNGFLYGIVFNRYKKKVKEEEQQARAEHIRDIVGSTVVGDVTQLGLDDLDDVDPYTVGADDGSSRSDERAENAGIGSVSRFFRQLFSWLIFIVSLCLSIYLVYVLYHIPTSSNPFWATMLPFITSISISVLNVIWKSVGKILTDKLERPRTWSATRKSALVKTFVFKMANLVALYAISGLVTSGEEEDQICPLAGTGKQFTVNIILDMTAFNALEIGIPLVLYGLMRKCFGSKKTDEEMRSVFDLSDEYLELFYRLSQCYFGTLGSPLIGGLCLIANLLEIAVDKSRLFYINRIPQRMESGMRGFIIFYLFIVGCCAFFAYPNGALIAIYNLWAQEPPSGKVWELSFFSRPDYQYCWD